MTWPRPQRGTPFTVVVRVFGLLLAFRGATAGAQEPVRLDVETFHPSASLGAGLAVGRPEVPRHGSWEMGLALSHAAEPLVREDGQELVSMRGQAELLLALGLFEWMELGVALPFAVTRVADDPFAPVLRGRLRASLSDARLSLKVPVLRGDGLRLGAALVASLPSGGEDTYAGFGYWSLTPMVLAAQRMGRIEVGAQLGYRFLRKEYLGAFEVDDVLRAAVALRWDLVRGLAALLETRLDVGVGGQRISVEQTPAEWSLGVRWEPTEGFTLDAGGGSGILRGVGAPAWRAFLVGRWRTAPEPCRSGPEDFDGFEDGDFCADPDNDGDGVLDEGDVCPNDAEDRDGFEDADGCPDPDNDGDGVPDERDRCPLRSEDRDGYRDGDGCPELDNDEDGLEDGLDRCPMEPEDRDAFEDEDGCPEPGPEEATITVTESRILVSQRIYFDFDTDVIKPVSKPLLDRLSAVIAELPADWTIRVEGYTDSEGADGYNLDLSYRRARAVVEYLVSRGIPKRRLVYVGYGERNPVASNESPEGRALNRRVEFTIVRPGERATPGRGRRGRRGE